LPTSNARGAEGKGERGVGEVTGGGREGRGKRGD